MFECPLRLAGLQRSIEIIDIDHLATPYICSQRRQLNQHGTDGPTVIVSRLRERAWNLRNARISWFYGQTLCLCWLLPEYTIDWWVSKDSQPQRHDRGRAAPDLDLKLGLPDSSPKVAWQGRPDGQLLLFSIAIMHKTAVFPLEICVGYLVNELLHVSW